MSIPLQSASLYDGQGVFVQSHCRLDPGTEFLVGNMVFVRGAWYLSVVNISMACILLWSSNATVHGSHAYRKMDVTREHIICVSELILCQVDYDMPLVLYEPGRCDLSLSLSLGLLYAWSCNTVPCYGMLCCNHHADAGARETLWCCI